MVFWNNDLWIMMHHKFICLLCVHHFSFFFVSSWCNQIIMIIFFVFFKLFDFDGFFYWWTVCQTKVQTIDVRGPLFKVIWKKNICSFKAQRGNNKGSHFVFYDKETWPHIISKTWLFSLSRNFNSRKKMVHVKVCPLLLFFFFSKPPFQVFSLADIFFFFFFFMLRDLLAVYPGQCAPFMLILHEIQNVGFMVKM